MIESNLLKMSHEDFFALLKEKCPTIFNNSYISGIECSSGWYDIIFDVSCKIEAIAVTIKVPKQNWFQKLVWPLIEKLEWMPGKIYNWFEPPIDCVPKVVQVKEKFGGLRYYVYHNSSEEVWQLIRDAEALSYKACEICGEPGVERVGGWIQTLCDLHIKKK